MATGNKLLLAGVLSISMFGSLNVFAQHVDADIPETLNGTYDLTYTNATGASPYTNGDMVSFVINGTNNTLCVDGTLLSNPYLRDASGVEEIWEDSSLGAFFALSDTNSNEFNEINVYAPGDSGSDWVGQFQGSRTSESLSCSGAEEATDTTYTENGVTVAIDVKSVLDLVSELYPGLFKNGSTLKMFQGYAYRYYASSGVFVGFKDGKVFLKGGQWGNGITEYGLLGTTLTQLQNKKASIEIDLGDEVSEAAAGDYTLTITGKYNSSLISINIPEIIINDIAAPSASDTDAIIDALSDLEIENLDTDSVSVITINDSANQVTFEIEFNATSSTLGAITYQLNYDYVK